MNRGVLYALGAYGLWGLFPLYWKLLGHVPALEILNHRVVWSLALLAVILAAQRRWGWIGRLGWRTVGLYLLTATALAGNWFVYIWAVNAGFVVETSLGYFINPLVSVVLGVVFLSERMRRAQWLAVGVASVGVAWLTWQYGSPPWIALTLASSFGFYGLMRKQAPLPSLEALSLEMALLLLPAVGYLLWLQSHGVSSFLSVGPLTSGLLMLSSVATVTPLLLFGLAAHRIPLSTLGITQYLAPTLQFLLGVFLYNEPFGRADLVGFGLIWTALLIYSAEGLSRSRGARSRRREVTATA